MHDTAILYPLFALGALTFCVLLLIPFARVRAALKRQVKPEDFKYGESSRVPPEVSIPNRNYMNLLELPVLFYVVGLMLFLTDGGKGVVLQLAWLYVALRVVHSVIHLSYNQVMHRLTAFALSNFVLGALWILAFLHVSSIGAGK